MQGNRVRPAAGSDKAQSEPHGRLRRQTLALREDDGWVGPRERDVQLHLIQPGKPNQNAYIESFNDRLRDEVLKGHWFPILLHARTEIKRWQWEPNEERPKKVLGGLAPAACAQQLAAKPAPMKPGL